MDEQEKAFEYLRARQTEKAATDALRQAREGYSPVLGALFPDRRHSAEEAAQKVMGIRDEAARKAEEIGWHLSPEMKRAADEALADHEKNRKR